MALFQWIGEWIVENFVLVLQISSRFPNDPNIDL